MVRGARSSSISRARLPLRLLAMNRVSEAVSVAAGLEGEVASLYERDAASVHRYATALAGDCDSARDAVQEAFFRYFLVRSGGQQIRSPKPWLIRVVRNYIFDMKKAGARNEIGLETLFNMPGPPTDGDPDERLGELLRGLRHYGLSPREAECVRLRAEDLRYDEIAAVLGLESGTVGALLARAHGKIRKAMDKDGRPFAASLGREQRYAS